MKILAIRGEGLASLAQPFEVALDAPPLRDAGVFAIVGPTGAGKSTLLDALCLALFDRTPRLTGRGERIGTEDDPRTAGDPRNLLRRGVGRAHAEVDFRGIDGQVYRARWEVRRARGKPDGTVQAATMSLREVESGRAVSDSRKGEVLAAIEERLGLSFAQFQRAVLLAQGRFAAFLEADDRERAELLERMTGTEIYGRISMEVARRAREERAALTRLEERVERLAPLPDDARAALEQSIPERSLDVARAAERVRAIEGHVRWWTELDLWLREETESRRELAELDAQLELAEARRREIEEGTRAEPLRAPLEARDRAAQAAEDARVALEAAGARAEGAAQEARRCAERLAEAAARDEAARARAQALEPVLRDARALDRELAAARARALGVAEQLARAERGLAQRASERSALERRREALEAELAEARVQRAAGGALDAISDVDAPRLLERLERLVALGAAGEEVAARLGRVRQEREPAEHGCARAASDVEHARRALERAEAGLAERRGARAGAPEASALREAVDRTSRAAIALAEASAASQHAETAAARARVARDAEASARRAAAVASARRDEAERALPIARAQLVEAERARDLARAMLDLSSFRDDLREGEACPLCGALDHPYARHAPRALADAQEARVHALREEVAGLERALAVAGAELSSERVAERRAAEAAEAAEREHAEESARAEGALDAPALRTLAAWWASAPASLRALVVEAGADVPWSAPGWPRGDGPAAEALLARARGRLAAALDAREALERSIEEALAHRDGAATELARAEVEARRAESALAAIDARVDELTREGARIAAERREVIERLAPWRAAVEAVGALEALDASALDRIQRALTGCARARAAEERARAALASLAQAEGEARAAEERVRAEHASAREAHALAEQEVSALGARRSALAGDDLDALEADARDACERARQARDAAAQALAGAESAREAALEARGRAGAALEAAAREAAAAEARLQAALEAAALSEDALRRVLSRRPEELAAWRRELAVLDGRRARGHAVLDERARRRAAHEATPPEGLSSRDEAPRELARARAAEEGARRLLASQQEALARDERLRQERDEARAALEPQRERVRTWSALEGLVGSADGKRFRVFAQGLTLELLLEHANAQLARLAPRYALRRTPGVELGVQVVDRELGDEIRGIKSLSGGETFLVSLALALALASLTARRVRVDSLFIDEGFGGLDAESLEVALAALDALQATGRQVGVVSHVGAMAERFAARVEVSPRGHAESVVTVVS